jgi:hypothetical protein
VFRTALAAVVVTAAVVGIGVFVNRPSGPPPAKPLATALSAADTTTMTVRRRAFCAAVPVADTVAALGSPGSGAGRPSSYRPGQKVALTPAVTDVADEWGCSWTGTAGRAARAWLFAPPVTTARATKLAGQVPKGCERVSAPAFGAPSAAAACGDTLVLRGLFGDAWLSCQLTAPGLSQARLLDRAGRWCLVVARAAG